MAFLPTMRRPKRERTLRTGVASWGSCFFHVDVWFWVGCKEAVVALRCQARVHAHHRTPKIKQPIRMHQEDQVFRQDQPQNVVVVLPVDGDAREARLVDVGAGLVVEALVGLFYVSCGFGWVMGRGVKG